MPASRVRISDVLAGGLHLHDIRNAAHATAKAERAVPTSSPLALSEESHSIGLLSDLHAYGHTASPSEIADGTSNTIILQENGVSDGSVRTNGSPEHGIDDGASNTVIGSEDDSVIGLGGAAVSPPPAIADGTSNTLVLSEGVGSSGDLIDTSGGHHRLAYQSTLDAGDVIQGFGTSACEQDVVDLDHLFDSLGVPDAERAARVSLVDTGADVELRLDTDGVGGADLTFLIFQRLASAGGLSVGAGGADDIQIGA